MVARLLLVFMFFISSTIFSQSTIYVNANTGDDDSGVGSSGSPFKTFHKAYTVASSNDIIDLTGTFDWTDADEAGDASISGYTIAINLTIQGQGADQTIVQAASTSNSADRRVFTMSSAVTVTFSDISIRNGKTEGSGESDYGGGIKVNGGANVTFTNCYIYDNVSNVRGGAIEADQSTLTITNSTISGNSGYHGGGIYASSNTTDIENSTIYNNTADNSVSTYGGGINLTGGTATIMNCTICDNSSGASNGGGGLEVDGNSLTIQNTIIANNTANASDQDVENYGGTITDNGYNIVEVSSGQTWNATGDISGSQADLFGTGVSSTPSLAENNTTNGTPTLKTISGSVAIDAGSSSNGAPTTDQRGASRNGTTDIGAYEYWDDAGSLPVELTTFTALISDNSVELNWNTATEVNNYGFQVERKTIKDKSENTWEKIGFVNGHGNSNSPKDYSFIDNLTLLNLNQTFQYRLKQIDFDGSYEYSNTIEISLMKSLPNEVVLNQNYPNPFNPATVISYVIPSRVEESNIRLTIYDMLGNEIATLVNKKQSAGSYSYNFDGADLASGTYIYKLVTDNFTEVKKMILLK
ncbi:MAG: choice-of-anchor Q domain-containing protein [Ignavibacteria bacterium]|jgi:hypothetical protein